MFLDELARVLRLKIPTERKLTLVQREAEKIAITEDELERQRLLALHKRYAGGAVDFRQEDLTSFNLEETIDLGIERKNLEIYNRPFKSITITQLLPGEIAVSPHKWGAMLPKAYIRFNSVASPLYRVRSGEVRGNFNKIFLTNSYQPGYSFSYVINSQDEASFGMNAESFSILEGLSLLQGYLTKKSLYDLWFENSTNTKKAQNTPTIFNVDIANPDTEYEQAIPANTKTFRAVLLDGASFRYAWVTGKVQAPTAPFMTQPANIPVHVQGLDFQVAKTFYFADDVGTKTMQIECYV